MKFSSGFEVAAFSDLEYEGMTVEVRYNGVPVAQLNQDKGPNLCEIEIPYRFSPERQTFTFLLDEFLEALTEAKKVLVKLG